MREAQAELEVEVPSDRPLPTQRGYRTLLGILTTAAEMQREVEEAA